MMTLEKFKEYMSIIQTFDTDYDNIHEYLNDKVMEKLYWPCDSLINLLTEVFDDESGWIGYWIYDLDFGTKWKEGAVTVEDIDVKMKTVEDLYKVLIDNNDTQV
jgi:hypothetical protein